MTLQLDTHTQHDPNNTLTLTTGITLAHLTINNKTIKLTSHQTIQLAIALLNTASTIDETLPGQDKPHDYTDTLNALDVLKQHYAHQ